MPRTCSCFGFNALLARCKREASRNDQPIIVYTLHRSNSYARRLFSSVTLHILCSLCTPCVTPLRLRGSYNAEVHVDQHLFSCLSFSGVRAPCLPGHHHPKAQVHRVFFLLGRAVLAHRLQYLGEDVKLDSTSTFRHNRLRPRGCGPAALGDKIVHIGASLIIGQRDSISSVYAIIIVYTVVYMLGSHVGDWLLPPIS